MHPYTRDTKYLLRFDDICPTMDWKIWSEIETTLSEANVQPILAVVPDNQDPGLKIDAARQDFWDRVRAWQARGWPIALHGYQHRYVTCSPGIVTGPKKTEFAGLPLADQHEKLRLGVAIFNANGIQPRLWIAPSNSFDAVTLSLLPKFGIRIVCDGCFRFPFVGSDGVFWIPQQLFGFRPAPPGVWTVCYHHNGWSAGDLDRFRSDVRVYRSKIGSLDQVAAQWGSRRSRISWFLCTSPQLSHLLSRVQLRAWAWWSLLAGWLRNSAKPLRASFKRMAGLPTR